jgi:hypothetical protein
MSSALRDRLSALDETGSDGLGTSMSTMNTIDSGAGTMYGGMDGQTSPVVVDKHILRTLIRQQQLVQKLMSANVCSSLKIF